MDKTKFDKVIAAATKRAIATTQDNIARALEEHYGSDDPTNSAWFELAHGILHDLKDETRGSYLPPDKSFKLDIACGMLEAAYDATCYLVGSATESKRYRDVDVRMIMADEEYDRLFGTSSLSPMWEVTCASISAWLQYVSELPVDFQIQRRSNANARYSRKTGDKRHPLGMAYRVYLEGDQLPEFLRKPKPDC